jgi:hypothetical protein
MAAGAYHGELLLGFSCMNAVTASGAQQGAVLKNETGNHLARISLTPVVDGIAILLALSDIWQKLYFSV